MRTSGDVKAVLEAVDGGNLALTALVCSTGDHDLVLDIVQYLRDGLRGVVNRTSLRTGMLIHVSSNSIQMRHMSLPSHVVLLAELLAQRRLRDVRIGPSKRACAGTLTDMIMRRTLEGALKCAFLDLRRELARAVLTLVMLAAVWCVGVSKVARRQLGIIDGVSKLPS
jgi:hypothetical protein